MQVQIVGVVPGVRPKIAKMGEAPTFEAECAARQQQPGTHQQRQRQQRQQRQQQQQQQQQQADAENGGTSGKGRRRFGYFSTDIRFFFMLILFLQFGVVVL